MFVPEVTPQVSEIFFGFHLQTHFLQAIGNYHSTKIWSFRMTAPCCQNKIEIHTDPKNARYIIVEGAKQKVRLDWKQADLQNSGICKTVASLEQLRLQGTSS